MSNPQLLILTSEGDLHADAVIKQLSDRRPDIGVVRLNTDNLPTNIDYCFHWNNSGEFQEQILNIIDSKASASSVRVIWYRKPDRPPAHPGLTEATARECSVQEYREFLRSIFGLFPDAAWVNDYWQMQRFSIKANQIKIARQVGLSIPETLLTNRLAPVHALANRHPEIIFKGLAFPGFAWQGTRYYACFTNLLPRTVAETIAAEDLAYAPALFQQRIGKAQELRVTVVRDNVFACEIQTRPGTIENVDWRVEGVDELPHTPAELPSTVGQKLVEMLKLMGLNFGAFDLIRDDTGLESPDVVEIRSAGRR